MIGYQPAQHTKTVANSRVGNFLCKLIYRADHRHIDFVDIYLKISPKAFCMSVIVWALLLSRNMLVKQTQELLASLHRLRFAATRHDKGQSVIRFGSCGVERVGGWQKRLELRLGIWRSFLRKLHQKSMTYAKADAAIIRKRWVMSFHQKPSLLTHLFAPVTMMIGRGADISDTAAVSSEGSCCVGGPGRGQGVVGCRF